MNQPTIHFAHANGFPAKVYSYLFEILSEDYNIIYKDVLGHEKKYPITKNWLKSGDEIVDFISATTKEKVIGIGHSFGATSTLNAAFKAPNLFSGIILIEPVIVNGFFRNILAEIAESINLVQYFSPAKKTEGRRQHWPDEVAAIEYFKSKKLFKNFHDRCFQDLIEHGLEHTDNGLNLVFDVGVEVDIFKKMPHHTDKFAGKLKNLPGSIISASKTNISMPDRMEQLAKQQGFNWEIVEGTHMLPLENPELTCKIIDKHIKSFNLKN